jgi:general stress protein 26
MPKQEEIRQRLIALFESQNLAVLATQNKGQPYASLVAFYATPDLKHLFFVTPKTTRKFSNLKADGRVALLVNSSINQAADFHQAIAVTVVGDAQETTGADRKNILSRYLAKHPYLEDFANAPTCALVDVTVKSYFMVKHFQNVMELHITG